MKKILSRVYARCKNFGKKIKIQKGSYISKNTVFEGFNKIGINTKFKGEIGFASLIGNDCEIEAKIGKYCSIGNNVNIIKYTHPSRDFVSTHPSFYSIRKQSGFSYTNKQLFEELLYVDENKKLPIEVGNDVWIGSNVTIIGGVKIGDGCIIGAGSLVVKNVEPYEIVGGVPAKFIRKRFSDEQIKFLLEIKWWNKGFAWLKENVNSFQNINNFINNIKSDK